MTAAHVEPARSCLLVTSPAQRAAHHAIRRAVFVAEKGVFESDDRDARDDSPATRHVLGLVDGVPAGTVRLYPLDEADPGGRWRGDRLAVLPEFRSAGLGAPLVRFAVATAGELGGREMVAHILPPNRIFFRRLGWTQHGGPRDYVGIPHLFMTHPLTGSAPAGRATYPA